MQTTGMPPISSQRQGMHGDPDSESDLKRWPNLKLCIWKSTAPFTKNPFRVICLSLCVICRSDEHFVHIFQHFVICLAYPCHKQTQNRCTRYIQTSKKICRISKRCCWHIPSQYIPSICRPIKRQSNRIAGNRIAVRFLNTTTLCSSSTTGLICFRRLCGTFRPRRGRRRPAASVVSSCTMSSCAGAGAAGAGAAGTGSPGCAGAVRRRLLRHATKYQVSYRHHYTRPLHVQHVLVVMSTARHATPCNRRR